MVEGTAESRHWTRAAWDRQTLSQTITTKINLFLVAMFVLSEVGALAIHAFGTGMRPIGFCFLLIQPLLSRAVKKMVDAMAEKDSADITTVGTSDPAVRGIVELSLDGETYAADATTMIVVDGAVVFEGVRSHFSIPCWTRPSDEDQSEFDPSFIFETVEPRLTVLFRSKEFTDYQLFCRLKGLLKRRANGALMAIPTTADLTSIRRLSPTRQVDAALFTVLAQVSYIVVVLAGSFPQRALLFALLNPLLSGLAYLWISRTWLDRSNKKEAKLQCELDKLCNERPASKLQSSPLPSIIVAPHHYEAKLNLTEHQPNRE